jgi:hypothetical protein
MFREFLLKCVSADGRPYFARTDATLFYEFCNVLYTVWYPFLHHSMYISEKDVEEATKHIKDVVEEKVGRKRKRQEDTVVDVNAPRRTRADTQREQRRQPPRHRREGKRMLQTLAIVYDEHSQFGIAAGTNYGRHRAEDVLKFVIGKTTSITTSDVVLFRKSQLDFSMAELTTGQVVIVTGPLALLNNACNKCANCKHTDDFTAISHVTPGLQHGQEFCIYYGASRGSLQCKLRSSC